MTIEPRSDLSTMYKLKEEKLQKYCYLATVQTKPIMDSAECAKLRFQIPCY